MTAHVEKERWRVCKARLRKALIGTVGTVVLLAVFRFAVAHFCWHVDAMLLPPLRKWPEELQRQVAAFREAGGDLKVREQSKVVEFFDGDWFGDGKDAFRPSKERVSYWDVRFGRRPVWTPEDVLAAFGPYDTVMSWDNGEELFGYDWSGGMDGNEIVFLFDHGVLTGVERSVGLTPSAPTD